MKYYSLTSESIGNLLATLSDLKKQGWVLRCSKAREGIKDTSQIRKWRRNVARVKTALSAAQRADQSG